MKIRNLILVLTLALTPFVGCSDPPQPVPPAPAASARTAAGSIALEGEKFDAPDTTVFVSVRPKGQKAPWLSRKYPMQSPQITGAAGKKVLAFELRASDPNRETFNSNGMTEAPAGIELELYVCVKEGGFVDSPTLTDASAPFVQGKTDYAMTVKMP